MKYKGTIFLAIMAVIVLAAAGVMYSHTSQMRNQSTHSPNTGSELPLSTHEYAKGIIQPKQGQIIRKFQLEAIEAQATIREGLTLPVWTYNGTVPGSEIRVTEGEFVEVTLTNKLKVPVTIHWHGYPLLSAMDGVPGINQDAVRPGETFTYTFSADYPGTYWYHSHQEGAEQVDKGLYGALIVEPKAKQKIDKDYTLILDEWTERPLDEMEDMPGMNMGGHGQPNPSDKGDLSTKDLVTMEEEMMAESYNIYTVNGKSGELITPLEVNKGDTVRLRFINAGYRTHGIHLPDQEFKVVSTDGQEIHGAQFIRDQIIYVAPGERYDIEFTVKSDEGFFIDAHDNNKYNDQIKIPVKVINGNNQMKTESADTKVTDFLLENYGEKGSAIFNYDQKYTVEYNVELGTKTDSKLEYTINGKTFDQLPPLSLKKGDTVKLTFLNKSAVDHPMHLHGHFFQVLTKDNLPLASTIMKDTLLVKPGEKYEVAFLADNPGNWVQHCHELHHAAAGMMMKVVYTDFISNYIPDPKNTFNNPE